MSHGRRIRSSDDAMACSTDEDSPTLAISRTRRRFAVLSSHAPQRPFPGAESPIRIYTACAAEATAPSGASVVLLEAMNAAMARAEMKRRRPIGTLASAPLRNRSYKVLRAMPPNNARACSIEYNSRSIHRLLNLEVSHSLDRRRDPPEHSREPGTPEHDIT